MNSKNKECVTLKKYVIFAVNEKLTSEKNT